MAQQAETTVAEYTLTSCVWARFKIGSNTMPGQRPSHPTQTSFFYFNIPSTAQGPHKMNQAFKILLLQLETQVILT